jgi:hypothetical protein
MPYVVHFLFKYIVQRIMTVSIAPGTGKNDYTESHIATHNNKEGGIVCRLIIIDLKRARG